MTDLLEAPAVATEPTAHPAARPPRVAALAVLEWSAMLAALGWWAVPMAARVGGRGPGGVAGGLATLVPALALTRPWRRLPVRVVLLGLGICAGALAVYATSPTGWYGADIAASYCYAALLTLAVLAFCRGGDRQRLAVVLAVCVSGLYQLGAAFLSWWGGKDPSREMTGTYYWHNPFAAALLAPALLGLGLAVRRVRPVQTVGWVVTPLSVAGIVLSSSRATLGCLLLGWVAVAGLVVRAPARRPAAVRFAAVTAVTVAVVLLLPGPPLFAHRVSPFAATSQRATGGETVSANTAYRTQFWREALDTARRFPLTGGGFHSLATAPTGHVPASWARSQQAHNGYLQAASDGGAALALPFLAALAALGVAALRRGLAGLRGRGRQPWLAVSGAAALVALAVHSAGDFDWSHPTLLAMLGVVGGVTASLPQRPGPRPGRFARPGPGRWWLPPVLAVALVGAAAGSWAVAASWDRTGRAVTAAQRLPVGARVAAYDAASRRPLADDRPALALLSIATRDLSGPLRAPAPAVRRALASTAGRARVDVAVALLRARTELLLGDRDTATKTVDATLRTVGQHTRPVAAPAAELLVALGRPDQARAVVAGPLAATLGAQDHEAWPLLTALLQVDPGHVDGTLEACAATRALTLDGPAPPALDLAGLPAPYGCAVPVVPTGRP